MKTLVLALFAALALAAPRAARADTAGFYSTGGGILSTAGSTVGYTFTLSTSIRLTQLGFWDYQANGLTAAVPVTIWDSTGTSVATGVVPAGTNAGEVNGYLYLTLPTSALLPAGTYTIGGYTSSGNDSVQENVLTLSSPTGIAWGASRSGTGTARPTGDSLGFSASYFGPNFQFATVPEPSTWTMLGAGVVGVGVVALRRRPAFVRPT